MKKKKHTVWLCTQKDFKWHLVLALVLTIIGNASPHWSMMSGKAINILSRERVMSIFKSFQIAVLMLVVYLASILTYLLSLLMVYISRRLFTT